MSEVGGLEPHMRTPMNPPGFSPTRLTLAALWIFVLATSAVVGERQATLTDLLNAVASGKVSEVHVAGALPAGSSGWATLDVRWRQGLGAHRATVVQASPDSEQEAADSGSSTRSVITTDVATLIRDRAPNAHVQVKVSQARTSTTAKVLGWDLPSWMMWIVLIGLAVTLGLIVNGPEPWRATRWGWAWALLFTGPIAAAAFAALSGPTPLMPRPKHSARRLTGGWAFLLGALLGPMITLSA
jgi:hypothetical protein